MTWLIVSIDDGLVGSADTKYEAYEQIERRSNIWFKRRIRAGLYEVNLGYPGDTHIRTLYVGRPEALAADGFSMPS